MTSNLEYSLSINSFKQSFSSIPDKIYMVKKGKSVFPVYDSTKSMTHKEVSMSVHNTSIPWKFIGAKATFLDKYVWTALRQQRRCIPVYIPFDSPVRNSDGSKIIAFIAASVDIVEVSITGRPIPKKSKRKNKKRKKTNDEFMWKTTTKQFTYPTNIP